MSHWSNYIQINEQTGTPDERLLVEKILDKGWQSPDMRAKIESLPGLYQQRMQEYEEIQGKPYSSTKESKVTIDIDNTTGSSAYALDNKVVFSPRQSASLAYEDTNGKVIQMSPTSILLHEIAGHMANPNETPRHDFENSKTALTTVFGDMLAKQYPDEHKKIAQDVPAIAGLKTADEVSAHLKRMEQKMNPDIFKGAVVTAQQMESEAWNEMVENQAVRATDKIMNEVYTQGNPSRGDYNVVPRLNQGYDIKKLLDSVDQPEGPVDAPKKPDHSSILEGISMSSSNIPGGFTGKADGGCTDPAHNHAAKDMNAAPQFAIPSAFQR